MDDKTNLYVFEKKEVFLIFIFMILIAVTSFVLGVKVGKSFTYADLPLPADNQRESLQFMSDREEEVKEISSEQNLEEVQVVDPLPRMRETLERELEAEQRRFEERVPEPTQQGTRSETQNLKGKYTIQLGSYRSYEEADQFASGFKARGYNPIIQEVELEDSGLWYRVSLGIFDTISQAKEYVLKERLLFEGEDYVFQRF